MTKFISIINIVEDKFERNEAYRHFIRTKDIYQDKNLKNYEELWDRLDEYEDFHIVYVKGEPLGMAGINDFYWKQKGVARILDRLYQFQRTDFNRSNMDKRISHYILEKQIDICRRKGIHTMFMSLSTHKRTALYQKHILDPMQKKLGLDPGFKLQPHLYNVCRQTEKVICDEPCWQGITVYFTGKDHTFMLPHRELS